MMIIWILQVPSRKIRCYYDCIALKFDRHLDSDAVDVIVNFQSDWKSLNPNLTDSRLYGETPARLMNIGPDMKWPHG